MAQHDMNIANQSFPSFRSDLNNALSAIQTTHSGTSRPTGAVAGQIWLDTTSATSPTLKFYDGADDISLATINYTANTVDWLDSSVTITGLSTTATGTVLTLTDTAHTTTVNMICGNNTALRFNELTANGSNYIGLKAPASLSADLTFTLPSTDGTNGQFLKTDGAGNLSFSSDLPTTSFTGATAETSIAGSDLVLIYDDSATAVRKMTRTNFVSGVGGNNTPAFEATKSSQTLSDATTTKIQISTELFDTNSNYDNATNYRFTPTTAGKYFVYLQGFIEATANYVMFNPTLYIYKNGSSYSLMNFVGNATYLVSTVPITVNCIVDMNGSTDYVEGYVYADVIPNSNTPQISAVRFGAYKLIGV